jgi:hypothetical protein
LGSTRRPALSRFRACDARQTTPKRLVIKETTHGI